MGAPLLHAGNQITCVHGGQGEVIFTNFRVSTRGNYFMTVGDTVSFAGCPGTPPPAQLVCVIAQYAMPATRVFICGQPALASANAASPPARNRPSHLRAVGTLTPAAAAASAGVSESCVICRTISSRRAKVSRAFLWWFIRFSVVESTGGLAISSLSSPVRMDHLPLRNNLLKLHN
mgnify:CR=1 FL=1